MRVSSTTEAPRDTAADTIAVGVFEGEPIAHDVDGVLQALVDSGEAKTAPAQGRGHPRGRRAGTCWPGSASATSSTPSAPASSAAAVAGRAKELGTRVLCWELPHHVGAQRRFVEGTVLAAYEYRALQDRATTTTARPGRADRLRAPRTSRRRRRAPRSWPRPPTPRATSRTRPANEHDADARWPTRARAPPGVAGRRRGRGRDRGGRHGRVRRRRARQPRGAAADHAPLRAGRRRRPGARPRRQGASRSTPAASRSSPGRR